MRISTPMMTQQGINSILDNQAKLSKTQDQMAQGKRVLSPADDPVAATQILNLRKSLEINDQYQNNADYVKNRLGVQEEVLGSAANVLQRVRELAVRANTDSINDFDREAIASEIRARLKELVGLANTKDGSGEYMFAGSKGKVRPFTYDAATGYQYNGDDKQRSLQVGPDYRIAQTDSGEDIFMRVENGNRTFVTDYNAGNTGTAKIGPGQITDQTALTGHNYTIDFVDPPPPLVPGVDPIQVRVFDNDTGNFVTGTAGPPPSGTPFQDGDSVTFDGITVEIDGEPAVGDSFTVAPTSSQSVFDTVETLATTLETTWTGDSRRAKAYMDMGKALQELDNGIDRITEVRAEVGARLNSVDGQTYVNEAYSLQMKGTLSSLEDLDYAKASGELNLQLVGLQAAQQVYTKVQDLSLFNYVR